MKLLDIHSLRNHYLIICIILVTLIIITIAISEKFINTTAYKASQHNAQRNQVTKITEKINTKISDSISSLDIYLIKPDTGVRLDVEAAIYHTYNEIKLLEQHVWVKKNLSHQHLTQFKKTLRQLQKRVNELLETRTTFNAMFPALNIASDGMFNINNSFLTEVNYSISETTNYQQVGSRHYLLLIELRDNWRKLTNAYRIYLITKLSVVSEERFQIDVSNLDIYKNILLNTSYKLASLKNTSSLGFETLNAIDTFPKLINAWFENYQKVVSISESGELRRDLTLMQNNINPLFNKIYLELDYITRQLDVSASRDLILQENALTSISLSLWLLAVQVVGFILFSTFLLYKNLLDPIERLSHTLYQEADGSIVENIPIVKTTEMKKFVDAFRHMQYQIHSRQVALEHMAMHDTLTSLPNRALMSDRLEHAIQNAKRTKTSLALLVIDLDRFKEINDTLGHHMGDKLLIKVANRLTQCFRDSDTVARLGGDEFSILLPDISQKSIKNLVLKLVLSLGEVYDIDEHNLYVSISAGIAIYPLHGNNSDELFQHADIAMYHSKRNNTAVTLYDPLKDIHNVEKV